METHQARKAHGPCGGCGSEVEPGHHYAQTTRDATAAEREDGAFWRNGWRMPVKVHAWCLDTFFQRLNAKREHERFWLDVANHREQDEELLWMRRNYHIDKQEFEEQCSL